MKLVSGILGMTLASAVAIVSANAADMYVARPGAAIRMARFRSLLEWALISASMAAMLGAAIKPTAINDVRSAALANNDQAFATEGVVRRRSDRL